MTLSRNAIYEHKLKRQGLKKITVWVPEASASDFKLMANYCVENPETTPFIVRDVNTGKFRKAV